MNPRASAPRMTSGVARTGPRREPVDRLAEGGRIGDQRHHVLEHDPLAREVRHVADQRRQVELGHRSATSRRSRISSSCASSCATRRGSRDPRARRAPLQVAGAKRRRDDLLEQRRLTPCGGAEGPQVPRVDPVPGDPGTRERDVGLALAVESLAALDAGCEQAEVLELARELGRDPGALAELGHVDLVLLPAQARGAALRAVGASEREAPRGSRGAAGTRRAGAAGS